MRILPKLSFISLSGLLYVLSFAGGGLLSSSVLASEPTYTPPQVGAPSRRVGGGTRGASDMPLLSVLGPESIGYTVSAQPNLYWAISRLVDYPVEIMLVESNPASLEAMQPLLETQIKLTQAGIQALSLKEHNIELKVGVEYEWFVALVRDSKRRSQDVITSGVLKRVELDENIAAKIKIAADDNEIVSVYATSGLWYDAIEALSVKIDKVNAEKEAFALRRTRANLLEQVKLPQIAALDRLEK